MNDALNLYSNNHNVSSISGYSFPINNKKKEYYFLRLLKVGGGQPEKDLGVSSKKMEIKY